MKEMLNKEAGFTLLELIVVVAVIGILAAIVVPQIGDIQGDARINSAKTSLANIQTALEEYKLNEGEGEYPASGTWDGDLGIDGSNYSYSTSTNNKSYVVTYDPDGGDSLSNGSIDSIDFSDAIGDSGNEIYYITSDSSAVILTTN